MAAQFVVPKLVLTPDLQTLFVGAVLDIHQDMGETLSGFDRPEEEMLAFSSEQSFFWVHKKGDSAEPTRTYASCIFAGFQPTRRQFLRQSLRGVRGLRRRTIPAYAAPGATKNSAQVICALDQLNPKNF